MTVAIVGLNGLLGPSFLETFTDPKFNSKHVTYYKYDDLAEVVQKAETLIVLTAFSPLVFTTVYELLSKPNSVELYFPSTFGFHDDQVHEYLPGLLQLRSAHVEAVRKLGIKTVSVNTGSFAIPNGRLYEDYLAVVGFNPQDSHVTYIGDGDVKFAVSSPIDIARSVSSVINNVPVAEIPDNLNVYSDLITPRQVVKQYLEKHPETEVTENSIGYADALAKAQEANKSFTFANFAYLLQFIAASGKDKGFSFTKSHRELVNGGETKWKWFVYDEEK